MPHIHICFLWHMHQPFYKDLVTGEYKLPWTRMHALKDYYGMVKVLEDFPEIHQTFNLVPSMLAQIEEYASGAAADPFLRAALKPAEELTQAEQEFILQYFFQSNPQRMIYRYKRYGELFDNWLSSGKCWARARRFFDSQALRDLQVLSQLAWFDEEFLTHDPFVSSLAAKSRDFTLEDQRLLGRKQIEVIGKVIPVYRDFAARGQIELSTTPYYHPILPLLCDTDIAQVSHPYVPLPPRFRYPQDAQEQLVMARNYMTEKIGKPPAGLWPSEGSVSDEVLHLAAEAGYRWFATDNGVLGRTLNAHPDANLTYRPYKWKQGGHEMLGLFRDHYLSDLIGFVYSKMGAHEAATHFLDRIRENCRPILNSGNDALVPIFLDGENAWEYYEESGRPFLRELYQRITDDKSMSALTITAALSRIQPHEIDHIFPGSWIGANFDVWIGDEEDNRAWDYLLKARQTYDRVKNSPAWETVSERRRQLAHEELLIAEGSDWNWWYGPQHDSANRPDFDQLYRTHLANVYTLLGLSPPDELSRPILKLSVTEFHQPPTGPVQAMIDGEVTSYFEWLGAGVYHVDHRSGAMHGQRFFVQELRYGSDAHNLFLRLDFVEAAVVTGRDTEIRIAIQPRESSGADQPTVRSIPLNGTSDGLESAFGKVCEIKAPLHLFGVQPSHDVKFQISLWQNGLPMEALPPQGWIELSTAEPTDWIV
ncbi:MAG: glycoside hydrolase family 57 protein [Bryobacteraceae bacterium]|nr:glycoside hydrolase family 57 protein [Bryobacteraceae bacterium]